MYKYFLLFFVLNNPVKAQDNLNAFFNNSDKFFKSYVKDGKVDYEKVKQNKQDIAVLIKSISVQDLKNKSINEIKAFYINAYNILVIDQIAKLLPVNENWYQQGFFDRKKHQVAGELISLDVLEKERLYTIDNDARLHFALVCGAKGCPPLNNDAYKPENLDFRLENHTIETLNDPKFIKLDQKNQKVAISEIFKWYQNDFVNKPGTILNFLNTYRKDLIPKSFKVVYYPYDWNVNKI
ncbi:MAG: DUF547 domain-containing protein [Bacteroidota bacterium]|nr:DUF547 domain-containing protein [Bacteroidota bacterium]